MTNTQRLGAMIVTGTIVGSLITLSIIPFWSLLLWIALTFAATLAIIFEEEIEDFWTHFLVRCGRRFIMTIPHDKFYNLTDTKNGVYVLTEEVKSWCAENLHSRMGVVNGNDNTGFSNHACLWFNNEDDMALFTLRWLW